MSQREADLRELVVTGLSHLVKANTEMGFKNCLPLAYDQDIRRRTIFSRVFARVLDQGTKFDQVENVSPKPNKLCEVSLSGTAIDWNVYLTSFLKLVKQPDVSLILPVCFSTTSKVARCCWHSPSATYAHHQRWM